ncbi:MULTISPECIES: type II and III secretion system protein [Methylomonas]|uniref:Type II and III secretion system protein n=2 Tax=Methylomonas TaxID=416 RepID=A0A126T6D1_9GAMM|nr:MULTISPECIES: type II and III secretion system protein [Methylomonas]AMK77635.1 type II and III secretion system protein [Methylomonas denitrificans]OAH96870.1 type II and III secretion system protein [Methylomonas methanica]TCV86804.1 type II/III secretion system protein [Methylomonas methanica]
MKSKTCLAGLILVAGLAVADESAMEVIPLVNRPASEVQALLTPLLDAEDRVIDNGSSLIVKTSPAKIGKIRALIQKLDARLSNLLISVLQTSSKTAAELNAEAAIAATPNTIHMRGMMGNTEDLRNRQQHQQLRTLEGQPAHIKTGEVRPVHNYSVYNSVYGSSVNTDTQMIEASTGFAVTPRLAGNQVILDVEPWSDSFQRNGNLETQSAHTTLRANLGEWVEIAGNTDTEQSDSRGFNSFNHRTKQNALRILIKVDSAD